MNTKIRTAFCGALLLLVPPAVRAQATCQIGTLPAINLNTNLGKTWRLNFKWESRQIVRRGGGTQEPFSGFDYQLSDLSGLVSKKVGLNNSLAAGYLIRLRDGRALHRLMQQFTIVTRYPGFRLAHRIATDQTFDAAGPPEFRLRYRIAAEFPLNGQSADPGEFYFKLNNEYLNALKDKAYDLEIRLVPAFGFAFTDNNKLELGLDYRASAFLDGALRSVYWISLNWFVKI